jgi:hypothetical protein
MKTKFATAILAGLVLTVFGCLQMPIVDDTARVRVVHASPDAPAVDVCADGAVLFGGAAFPAATAYAEVPEATYAVRVVPAGAGCGHPGVINAALPLAGGTDTTVVAVNVLAEIEPIVLADDNAAPAQGQSRVRFVHASPDAPAVDITLTDGTTLFDDVAFKEDGGYITVSAGTYDLQVRDETGTTVILPVNGVALASGKVYTVFAVGLAGGDPSLSAFVTVDN